MMLRVRFNVFACALKMGFRQAMSDKLPTLGALVMLAALVVAYAGVYRWIPPETLVLKRLHDSDMVWYLIATEMVLFCVSLAHFKELQNEIRTDQIHLALLRPCPLWVVKLGDWGGQFLGRLTLLALPVYALGVFATHGTTPGFSDLCGLLLSLPLAATLMLMAAFLLGVSCLWIGQADPANWVWHKSMFLLGALLWPLSFYPPVMQHLVWLTPFPAMLSTQGQWVIGANAGTHVLGALHQLFWIGIGLVVISAADRGVLRKLQRSGE